MGILQKMGTKKGRRPHSPVEKPGYEVFDPLSVGARGFEPPTSSTRTTRATELRYGPHGLVFRGVDEVFGLSGNLGAMRSQVGSKREKSLTGLSIVSRVSLALWPGHGFVRDWDRRPISEKKKKNGSILGIGCHPNHT
jgi:hypothetical protein